MRYSKIISSLFITYTAVALANPIALVDIRDDKSKNKLLTRNTQILPRVFGEPVGENEGNQPHVQEGQPQELAGEEFRPAPTEEDKQRQIAKDNGYEEAYTQYTNAQKTTASAKEVDDKAQAETALLKSMYDREQKDADDNPTKANLQSAALAAKGVYEKALATSTNTRAAYVKAGSDEEQMLRHLEWAKLNTPFGDRK